ncbi:MAG: hypothetical protein WD669_01075 [Pirellulales bacterium]
MGVTIHYRGSLADLGRVEDFEDRVIDLALAVGGNVRLWRSADKADNSRMMRGLILDLAPGQDTTSLLVSPEGWFTSLFEIEDAAKGRLSEPSWVFVKTQFGPIEGHVALVELLDAIKKEFAPNLEVEDEGNYWQNRDVHELRQKIEFLNHATDVFTAALEGDRLSSEAREDPEILATRIERIARKVHETISRPAEHPPVHFPDDGAPPDAAENEARWDEMFNHNRRNQERMSRVIDEKTLGGDDSEAAFHDAIEEVIAPFDWMEDDEPSEERREVLDRIDELNEASRAAVEEAEETDSEPWQESLPAEAGINGDDDDADDPFGRTERDPLQQQTTNLLMSFYDLAERLGERTQSVDILMRSAMEITGGLAQVLPLPPPYEIDDTEAGLSLVQLKRALRGAAFVRGAFFLLRDEKAVDDDEFKKYMNESDAISKQIVEMIRSIREART